MDNGQASLLGSFPLPLIWLLLLVASLGAREVGALLHRWHVRRNPARASEAFDAESYVISAIFGLLAFMVGFSFSISLDRFENRRALVVEEANAINTTYLRANLFDEPYRSSLQRTLRDYTETRVAPDGLWDSRMDARLAASLRLRRQLWTQTQAAVFPVRQTEMAAYLLDAVSETLSIGTQRQLAARAQIPTRIKVVVILYLVSAAAVLGYVLGDRLRHHRPATTALLTLFSVMILTVVDLDRPQDGAIQIPQRALTDLLETLSADAGAVR